MSQIHKITEVHVDFKKFVDMSSLQFNCLYRTLNEVNKKTDHLNHAFLTLNSFDNTITKLAEIDKEIVKIHEECTKKFEILKQIK